MARSAIQEEFIKMIAAQQKLIHSICSLYYTSSEDRKDLFQEIILALWKAYPAFNYQSKISTWIYQIAINTVFSRIRKDKRRPKSEPLTEKVWQIPQTTTVQELSESAQELYWAISQLSDVDKAIIMLYLEEHSYQEIASILDITKTNVSTRINRIKIKLEKLLNCKYNEFR
jgi:RNA polymerase sigma-70 factor (ECF subfamily)